MFIQNNKNKAGGSNPLGSTKLINQGNNMKHLIHLALIGALSATLYASETVSRITEADYIVCVPQEVYDPIKKEVIKVYSEMEQDEKVVKFDLKDEGKTFGALDFKYQRTNKQGYMVYEEQKIPVNLWVTIGKNGSMYTLYIVEKDVGATKYKCIARKN